MSDAIETPEIETPPQDAGGADIVTETKTPPADEPASATPQGFTLESLGYGEPADGNSAPPVVKAKRGRPRKVDTPATVSTAPAVAQAPRTPAERKAQKVASEELARAILGTGVGAMVALVGPEWDFQSPEEAAGMKAAVATYIDAKGDGKISPEAMLLLVVAGYALPRAAEPNTREKLGAFFGGLWSSLKNGLQRVFK